MTMLYTMIARYKPHDGVPHPLLISYPGFMELAWDPARQKYYHRERWSIPANSIMSILTRKNQTAREHKLCQEVYYDILHCLIQSNWPTHSILEFAKMFDPYEQQQGFLNDIIIFGKTQFSEEIPDIKVSGVSVPTWIVQRYLQNILVEEDSKLVGNQPTTSMGIDETTKSVRRRFKVNYKKNIILLNIYVQTIS